MSASSDWIVAIVIALSISYNHTTSDFNMVLANRRGNYLNYTGIPDLGSFTLCFWMRQKVIDGFNFWAQTILTYANDQNKQAIELKSVGGGNNGVMVTYMGLFVFFPQVNIKDRKWHQYCLTFNYHRKLMTFYVDGEKNMTNSAGSGKGSVMKGGGCLIVGFNQADKCGPPDSSGVGFTGILSHFNMWDTELDDSDVKKVFMGCDMYVGNVLSWKLASVNKTLVGGNITQPSSACTRTYASRTYNYQSNRILIGHSLSHNTVSTSLECALMCLRKNGCESFNYFEKVHNNCQLNASDDIKNPDSFKYSSGVKYGTYINKLERLNSP